MRSLEGEARRAILAATRRSEGAERDFDDVQPSGESVDRVLPDLLAAGAERLVVGAVTVGRSERVRDGREELAELGADPVGEGLVAGGLAHVPNAVADVPLLIVMNVGVAIHEPWEQFVPLQVAGGELERGQPEGALDHDVVGGDEVDLRGRAGRVRRKSVVSGHERLVEDDGERVPKLLARPCHMRGDRCGSAITSSWKRA